MGPAVGQACRPQKTVADRLLDRGRLLRPPRPGSDDLDVATQPGPAAEAVPACDHQLGVSEPEGVGGLRMELADQGERGRIAPSDSTLQVACLFPKLIEVRVLG